MKDTWTFYVVSSGRQQSDYLCKIIAANRDILHIPFRRGAEIINSANNVDTHTCAHLKFD